MLSYRINNVFKAIYFMTCVESKWKKCIVKMKIKIKFYLAKNKHVSSVILTM